MPHVDIRAFAEANVATLHKQQSARTPHLTALTLVITWSLAAAIGITFWLLLFCYGIPMITKIQKISGGAVKVNDFAADSSPNTEAAEC